MKIINFLFIGLALVTFTACLTTRNIKYPFLTINELWKYDTCGTKGFRLFLINYIEKDETEKNNIFIGQSIKILEYYFGQPDSISNSEDDLCFYTYNIDTDGVHDKKCGNPINKTLYVSYSKKTEKIIMFHAVVH